MVKLEKFFKHRDGSYFGIIGCILGVTILIIASILYASAEPFNFFTHWISNLGIGPNNSNIVFNVGVLITCIILFPFMINISYISWKESNERIHKGLTAIMFTFSILTLLGLMIVALFPLYQETIVMHLTGAMLFFISAVIFSVLFTIIRIMNKNYSKIQILLTLFVILAFTSFIIAIFDTIAKNSQTGITLELIQAFFRDSGEPLWVRFMEWMYLFSFLAFILDACLESWKK